MKGPTLGALLNSSWISDHFFGLFYISLDLSLVHLFVSFVCLFGCLLAVRAQKQFWNRKL